MQKIACLVDGEHYIPNIKDTLERVRERFDIAVAIFIGGTEKIASPEEVRESLGLTVEFAEKDHGPDPEAVGRIAGDYGVEMVLDLSDEPIVNYDIRMRIACEVLAKEIVYEGADFRFNPMRFKKMFSKPSMAIWGTGKRIGKTAIGGFVGRSLKEAGLRPGIVTLGRGGPPQPEMIRGDQINMDPTYLLGKYKEGFHAASDHFEDALTSRVITIGCRRCGGGFSGKPYDTIVDGGAQMAEEHEEVGSIILEGSGATFPEIKTDKVILLVGASQPLEHILGYMGPFRIKHANLVIVAMCEEPMAPQEKVDAIVAGVKEINPDCRVVTTVFRPEPIGDIRGRKVFFATTAPEAIIPKLTDYLETEHGCEVVATSPWLSNRVKLKEDLAAHLQDVDMVVTELKAAAVSVVVNEAVEAGLEARFLDNIPVVTGGDVDDLRDEVVGLLK